MCSYVSGHNAGSIFCDPRVSHQVGIEVRNSLSLGSRFKLSQQTLREEVADDRSELSPLNPFLLLQIQNEAPTRTWKYARIDKAAVAEAAASLPPPICCGCCCCSSSAASARLVDFGRAALAGVACSCCSCKGLGSAPAAAAGGKSIESTDSAKKLRGIAVERGNLRFPGMPAPSHPAGPPRCARLAEVHGRVGRQRAASRPRGTS